jgi:hypothetical protein
MHTLLRFGNGSRLYTFPTGSQITYSDDFDKLNNKLVQMVGSNSRLSSLGMGRGQSAGGMVKADVWLEFDDYAEATDKVNSIRQMADWGLQQLWRQPLVGKPQFCWARLSSESLNQDVKNVPHKRQRIPLVFDVPDPFWHRTVSGAGFLWDDGVSVWDQSGLYWDADSSTTITNDTTASFSNPGNAFTIPRVFLVNSSGSTVGNIRVQRVVNGMAEDEFSFDAPLLTDTYLDVDPLRRRVAVGPVGQTALASFRAKHNDWMRLMPGSNSIRVTCDGQLSLSLQYLERNI